MENLIIKIAEQVPNLGILGLIVYFFLNHLAKRDEVLREFHREHLDERVQGRKVISENTESNRELIEILQEFKGKNHSR